MNSRQKKAAMLSFIILVFLVDRALADITSMDPFEGDAFEDFTPLLGSPIMVPSVDIFDDQATVNIVDDGGSILVAAGSSLDGDLVVAFSAPLAIAQIGISEWTFHIPVIRFGAYFENNSATDDAVLEFYDCTGNLIGTDVATVAEDGQMWVWNGWESGTPINRIVCTGNDDIFQNGFIWFDDVQISFPYSPGDINRDGSINLLDVEHFVELLMSGAYQVEADLNNDSLVDLLDIPLFVEAINGK